MKNLILAVIIVLFTVALSSCTKKINVQANSVSFSSNPFSIRSNLATAD